MSVSPAGLFNCATAVSGGAALLSKFGPYGAGIGAVAGYLASPDCPGTRGAGPGTYSQIKRAGWFVDDCNDGNPSRGWTRHDDHHDH